MEQRVSLITLGVADLQKAAKFYEDKLGWKRSESSPEIVFFDLNGVVFSLYEHANMAKETGEEAIGTGSYKGFALAHNLRSEAAVDAVFADLQAKGVEIVEAPKKQFWGGYSGYICDLDGYKWEIAYNPFWPIDDDGNISTTGDQNPDG